MRITMQTMSPCPACGQPDALIALGTRYDHPHRWRPWVTTLTRLYLCDRCEALAEVRDVHDRGRGDQTGATRPRGAVGVAGW